MVKKPVSKTVQASQNTMMKVMSPLDANHYGYVHGGAIMRSIDEAAFITATRHAGRNTVTAAVDHLSFKNPVYIGEILILKSSVNFVGKTSMEIGVKIESENPASGTIKRIGSAYVTMVALDEHGDPITVPSLIVKSAIEKQRHLRAQQRRAFRLKLRKRK